ncbi:MAG: flagellar hook-length control protein FliK [Polyangiaceae bacterium]|nr:flagellar hook-length control protein FliK [Polyangiaceae bacterium]
MKTSPLSNAHDERNTVSEDDMRRRCHQAEVERWSAMLCDMVAGRSASVPFSMDVPGSPDTWRRGVGQMTPVRPGFGQPGIGQPCDASGDAAGADRVNEPGRVQMRVDSEQLGEVAIVVERREGGVRVVIGSADAKALALFGAERETLMQALATVGLAVETVRVVQLQPIGTVLAQPLAFPRGRRVRGDSGNGSDRGLQQKRSKRLDVTG